MVVFWDMISPQFRYSSVWFVADGGDAGLNGGLFVEANGTPAGTSELGDIGKADESRSYSGVIPGLLPSVLIAHPAIIKDARAKSKK